MAGGYSVKRAARLLAGASLLAAAAAQAQGAPPESPAGEAGRSAGPTAVGEVVVTSQKREEHLKDVPIAVSAITATEIENRNVTTLDQLQAEIPSLRMVDIGPGSQRIELRGISQYQGLPTVGNYVDEFSINGLSASGSPEVRLLDMQRVEVLRGPQPTLYGEGSMGGTIRYVTADPDLTRFGGSLLGEVSGIDGGGIGYRSEGVLNLPIVTDRVGLRLSAAQEHYAGWISGRLGQNANARDWNVVRGKFTAKLTDRLTVTLLGQYNDDYQRVKSYSNADRVTAQVVPSIALDHYGLATALVSYDAGPFTILSSTGYLLQQGRSVDDSAKFYNQLFGAPLLETAVTDARGTLEKWSQELRITSNGSGPFRYLFGATYNDTKSSGTDDGTGTSAVIDPELLGVVFTDPAILKSDVFAMYGNLSYDLGRFTVDAGGRYFRDERRENTVFTLIGLPSPPSVLDGLATFETFNPRASLSYHTGSSGSFYVDIAKGFRSGGFNQITAPVVPATFKPETLWTYEGGFKQSLFDGRIYLDAAVYYNDYKDIQSNQLVNPTIATVVNAGKASGPGVDFSFEAKPIRYLSLNGSVGWNHLRYDQKTQDRNKGDPADLVPDWNASGSVDYNPPVNDRVSLIAHADINYTSKAYIILRSPPLFNEAVPNQDRTLVNTRLGATVDKRYEVYLYVTNLFDTYRIINPAFGAYFEPTYTRARTIGGGVSARF